MRFSLTPHLAYEDTHDLEEEEDLTTDINDYAAEMAKDIED